MSQPALAPVRYFPLLLTFHHWKVGEFGERKGYTRRRSFPFEPAVGLTPTKNRTGSFGFVSTIHASVWVPLVCESIKFRRKATEAEGMRGSIKYEISIDVNWMRKISKDQNLKKNIFQRYDTIKDVTIYVKNSHN